MLALLMLTGTLLAGCATSRIPPRAPLDDQTRARLGVIAIAPSLSASPALQVDDTPNRSEFVAMGAKEGVRLGLKFAGSIVLAAGGHPGSLAPARVVFIAMTPLAVVLIGATGLLQGDTQADLDRAVQALDTAAAEMPFEENLRATLISEIRRRCEDASAVPPASASVNSGGASAAAENCLFELTGDAAPAAFRLSTAAAGDTWLHLAVTTRPILQGSRDNTGPAVMFRVGVMIRLVSVRTGGELYFDHLHYRSAWRRVTSWGRDDARIFREELTRCFAAFSAEIVEQLFLRPADQPVERGLLRRRRLVRL